MEYLIHKSFKVLSLKFKVKMQNLLIHKNAKPTLNLKPETLNYNI